MRVRFVVAVSGHEVGDEAECSENEAVRLFSARFAVPAPAPIERAVKKPSEKRKK